MGTNGQIDRAAMSGMNQALSKAIAFKNIGQDAKARVWAETLIRMMQQAGMLEGSGML